MPPPPSDPRGRGLDADLLGLVAEVAGLDAVALVVSDESGLALRGSWPRDRAGLEMGDGDDIVRLLADLGGGGRAVSAAAPVDEGVEVVLWGSIETGGRVSEAATARAMEAFVGLLASRLGLEDARRRAEEARSRMASLVDAGLSLGRELALDDLLSRIVQAARTVLGARYAALGVLDSTGTELARFVTAGLTDAQREAIGPLPRGRGILGVLISDARPLRLERLGDDPRSSGFPPNHPPMESFLGRSGRPARQGLRQPLSHRQGRRAVHRGGRADRAHPRGSGRRGGGQRAPLRERAPARGRDRERDRGRARGALDAGRRRPPAAGGPTGPAPHGRRHRGGRAERRRRARLPLCARGRRAGTGGQPGPGGHGGAGRGAARIARRPRGGGVRARGGRRDGGGARRGGLAALR